MNLHPRKDDHGNAVVLHAPSSPSAISAWEDCRQIASVIPDGAVPDVLNGIILASWRDAPRDFVDWSAMAKSMEFEEPPFESQSLKPAAGAVVVEPDGRIWLVSPSNAFGGYKTTFAKGKADGFGLKETALKEVFEETGLQVELFGHLIDVTKSTSRTRYYLAKRLGGSPADMCWETQAVHLVPLELAKGMLNQSVDHQVIDELFERRNRWSGWFLTRESLAHEQTTLVKMGRPMKLAGPIGELAKKLGSVDLLAKEIGTTPRTVYRWAKEGVASKMAMKSLLHLCEHHEIDPAGLLDLSSKD